MNNLSDNFKSTLKAKEDEITKLKLLLDSNKEQLKKIKDPNNSSNLGKINFINNNFFSKTNFNDLVSVKNDSFEIGMDTVNIF